MTNNKQSSSIDFFWNQIPEILPFTVDTETAVKLLEAFEQAKAMHKEEIENSYDYMRCIGSFTNGKEYYNETFGGNND